MKKLLLILLVLVSCQSDNLVKQPLNHIKSDTVNIDSVVTFKSSYGEDANSYNPFFLLPHSEWDFNIERYFMYGYHCANEAGSNFYGVTFIKTDSNYFPSFKEIEKMVYKKLPKDLRRKDIVVYSITEFKNEDEYLKFRTQAR